MNFENELLIRTKEAEKIISEYFLVPGKYDNEIKEAMNYSVSAGGKRLRPVIMMSFYRLFGGCEKCIEPFMAAMEMLHNYSLVHDDLPAIDNDDLRRGKPTTHKKYGEAIGILAGDGLLHQSFETAITAFKYTENHQNVINALEIFCDKTGINGMFGGQAADVVNTGKEISDGLLYYIYEKKTGALIEGSMMIGSALCGVPEDIIKQVEKAGALIGLAFQIRDDILDLTGNEAELGKPVLSDERNNKKTYVSINGIDKSLRDVNDFTASAVEIINNLDGNKSEKEFLTELCRYLTARNK